MKTAGIFGGAIASLRPLIIAVLILLAVPLVWAKSSGVLLGLIMSPEENPIAGAAVELVMVEGPVRLTARSAEDGSFALVGIPPGKYRLAVRGEGFAPFTSQAVTFEPTSEQSVRVTLTTKPASPDAGGAARWTDLTDVSARTVIDGFQVQALPSANNIWSLIENQDFSATTNRIDVGGIWASLPALWSSRGSVSWTQSSYLINGLEAADPYTTGLPLFHPDPEAIDFMTHGNGRHPASDLSPGGVIDIAPKQGTDDFHGALGAWFTTSGLASESVPSRIQDEGLFERTRLNSFGNYNVQLSGPVIPQKLHFYTSLSRLNVNRDVAEFEPDDKGTVSSALVNLTLRTGRGSLRFLWTGQAVRHPTLGAGRKTPVSATLEGKNLYNIFQFVWDLPVSPNHQLEIAGAFNRGNLHSRFQDGISEPHGEEVFRRVSRGAAAWAGRSDRTTAVLQVKGQSLFGRPSGLRHHMSYGISLRHAAAASRDEVFENIHLHYLGDAPFEVVKFNTPVEHEEQSAEIHLFAEDQIIFRNLASFSLGVHIASSRGRALQSGSEAGSETGKITWLNTAPRLSFALPILSDKSLIFRVSAGRYFFHLPLQYLTYGNPRAWGGLAYSWTDGNRDGRYQPGEEGDLWRREGPLYTEIDAGIKRPYTDEYAVSVTKAFGGRVFLTLAGFYRETRNLVETLNVGVPLTAYSPVDLYDPGDDTLPATHDDLFLTVYDQDRETLGNDFFLLTNPDAESRVNRYRGLDLTLVKKFGSTVFFLAATATEAIGTASPGNSEFENDDGVIGSLYDNPNTFIFSKGRLRFDRAYTARLGVSFPLPLGFRLAGLAKYYDGQPFSRKIIVTGFNQGPFYVQAFSRGVARYEFNMTIDLRLEKSMALGSARGRVFVDAYNVFNWANATEEYDGTGPEFLLRNATEVQSPRVIRIGVRYEF